MAKLEGYTCDTCGKNGTRAIFSEYPNDWYKVTFLYGFYKEFTFCSTKCLKKWVEVDEVPESRGRLFLKLLKAVFS